MAGRRQPAKAGVATIKRETKHWTEALVSLKACEGAIEWARGHDSIDEAWQACERGDWMLWLLGRLAGEPGSDARRRLVLCACDCAETAREHWSDDVRPACELALTTASAWARRQHGVTLDDVQAASWAAFGSADAAYWAASDAASWAAAATSRAASRAAASQVLRQCADIVRRHYPSPPAI